MPASVALVPWDAATQGKVDFERLKWELYNLDEDFSQADDLAVQHPDKVKSLEQLWWAEAALNKVLPVDTRGPEHVSDQIMGRPSRRSIRRALPSPTPTPASATPISCATAPRTRSIGPPTQSTPSRT